jgi:hypothetical protein
MANRGYEADDACAARPAAYSGAEAPPSRAGPTTHPKNYRLWLRGQAQVADSWPTRRGRLVSVALWPTTEHLCPATGKPSQEMTPIKSEPDWAVRASPLVDWG